VSPTAEHIEDKQMRIQGLEDQEKREALRQKEQGWKNTRTAKHAKDKEESRIASESDFENKKKHAKSAVTPTVLEALNELEEAATATAQASTQNALNIQTEIRRLATESTHNEDSASPLVTMMAEQRELQARDDVLNHKYTELVKEKDSHRLATDQEVHHPSSWKSKRRPPTAGTYQENVDLKTKVAELEGRLAHKESVHRDLARHTIKDNNRLSKQV
jgi:hypothetical protein